MPTLRPEESVESTALSDEDISENDVSDEEDISPLEYARLNGLARDHILDDESINHLLLLQEGIVEFLDHSHLPQTELQNNVNENERIAVSQGAARLLASVAQGEMIDAINELIFSLLGSMDVKKMRVDLPLLRNDHESDCREFAQREGFEPKLEDIHFPLEMVDIENNEGLEFPGEFDNFETEMFETSKHEKIEITRDSIRFLQNAIKTNLTQEEKENVWNGARTNRENRRLPKHITPPLSPVYSPPLSPVDVPSSVCQISLLSDPVSLTATDLQRIEEKVLKEDLPTPIRERLCDIEQAAADQHVKPADIHSSTESMEIQTPSPEEIKRVKVADVKVEELLTSPAPANIPKTVRFNKIVEELVFNRPDSALSGTSIDNKFFEEAFGNSRERATQRVEQERLTDSTLRVEVQKMNFSTSPPWSNPLSNSLQELIKEIELDRSPWQGLKEIKRQLRWLPFPNIMELPNIGLAESLGDDQTWKSVVHDPNDNDVVTSSDLTWKMEGLRILAAQDDDDDEIEVGCFEERVQDLSSLARKRKREIESFEPSQMQRQIMPGTMSKDGQVSIKTISAFTSIEPHNTKRTATIMDDSNGLLGGIFSAKTGLDTFLQIRGVKKPKLQQSNHFSSPGPSTSTSNQIQNPAQKSQQLASQSSPILVPTPSKPCRLPLPTPHIPPSTHPITIILSAHLLKNRPLIRHLDALLPTLTIYERDFSSSSYGHLSFNPAFNHNSTTNPIVLSSLIWEADILISPCTGIILTTMRKIKQRVLPGTKGLVAIRDRIHKVNAKYERLVILVCSEERDGGLSEGDCSAWADFAGWCGSLNKDGNGDGGSGIIVNLILGVDDSVGGQEILAKWIAGLVVTHTMERYQEVLEMESYWEVFLRSAGMNSFAAQVVVGLLKSADGHGEGNGSSHGLTAFVQMGEEERFRRFGNLCGRKVIERVGDAIDRRWK